MEDPPLALIFGFDIGTTSIGFAVIEHDPAKARGAIKRLGVRIFPEARDPKGAPLNQERRQARMRRRQLRRRRERRRLLADALFEAGLLPSYGSPEWDGIMKPRNKSDSEKYDPYDLRTRAFEGEPLSPYEFGRTIYHLAQRRHFKGRDIDEISDDAGTEDRSKADEDADEKKAKTNRESTIAALKGKETTLGAWLAERGSHERKRGVHATRKIVEDEFDAIWEKQKKHLSVLQDKELRSSIREAIFAQRPVFWRKNTLGECRFVPEAPLCPRGAWLSQQKRMLEKVNNLAVGGSARPLDAEERQAILDRLQTQASMTWGVVKSALKSLYHRRGMAGMERRLKFNLEQGGEKKLIGNPLEAKLADIFGKDWQAHPRKQEIRDAVHARLWSADYGEVRTQRVVILPAKERKRRREKAAHSFMDDFGVTREQAERLKSIKLPAGWEPYSVEALQAFLPHLEDGVRFGELVSGPEWEDWRKETFPGMEQPTGEIRDRLPSPADPEERARIAKLRNPTVARTHNELRKVVNNLIGKFGKPDLIRLELTREVGMSKRKREEMSAGMRKQEGRRNKAREALEERGKPNPSRDDIEKWMLWEECGRLCPYTAKPIGFEPLFDENEFQVEHIWPRSRSFDNSFRNKTLCHRDENLKKGDHIPFEYLGSDEEDWARLEKRLEGMKAPRGGVGMSPGKIRRFLAREIPDGFATRQLNDTGYAAREAVSFLKQLWPDAGPEAPVTVQAVSGRVTAQLRRLWGLNDILGKNGKKTREDHRHHSIDALAVACAHPGMTQNLSRYWQVRDLERKKNPATRKPRLELPWETIRADAEKAVAGIIVSHRVRKKVSGPLHLGTIYGDTRENVVTNSETYRYFVTRKKVEELSKRELDEIRDEAVREIVQDWVDERGGDLKKAFPPYPKRGREGPEIRKVRLLKKQQLKLMAKTGTGYAELGSNNHMAIYRLPDGKVDFEVVSLFDAARRLVRREEVVRRKRDDGACLIFSLSQGDVVEFLKGQEKGLWVVHSIASEGRPALARINDARPTTDSEAHKQRMGGKRKDFRPRLGGFMKRCPKKISVDPIGRIRPASD